MIRLSGASRTSARSGWKTSSDLRIACWNPNESFVAVPVWIQNSFSIGFSGWRVMYASSYFVQPPSNGMPFTVERRPLKPTGPDIITMSAPSSPASTPALHHWSECTAPLTGDGQTCSAANSPVAAFSSSENGIGSRCSSKIPNSPFPPKYTGTRPSLIPRLDGLPYRRTPGRNGLRALGSPFIRYRTESVTFSSGFAPCHTQRRTTRSKPSPAGVRTSVTVSPGTSRTHFLTQPFSQPRPISAGRSPTSAEAFFPCAAAPTTRISLPSSSLSERTRSVARRASAAPSFSSASPSAGE